MKAKKAVIYHIIIFPINLFSGVDFIHGFLVLFG